MLLTTFGIKNVNEIHGFKRKQKADEFSSAFLLGSGDRTRTCDLWVMSPTSYQLLHPALSNMFPKMGAQIYATFVLVKLNL